MKKVIWGVIIGIASVLALSGSIWAVSSYWHDYRAVEVIHETEQKKEIGDALKTAQLAMQKSQLAIDQQRVAWLEERIWEMEDKYGCIEDRTTDSCSGKIRRTYQKYLKEYQYLLDKISEQTTGD